MRRVTINPVARIARAEAGAVWHEVVDAADGHGLAALAGSAPDVGVVGYTIGGGISWLGRSYGLAANNVEAIEVVTAEGRLVRADACTEPDLFWALRGGGGSFGVVTAIELRLFPVTEVYAGQLWWPAEAASPVLQAWRDLTQSDPPEEFTSAAGLMRFPAIPDVPEQLRGRSFAIITVSHLGQPAEADALLAPLRALGPVTNTVQTVPAAELLRLHMDPDHPVSRVADWLMLASLPAEAIEEFIHAFGSHDGQALLAVELIHADGEMKRARPGNGALAAIDADYALFAGGMAPSAQAVSAVGAAVAAAHDALRPWAARQMYLNLATPSSRAERKSPMPATASPEVTSQPAVIHTPDQRVRVFVSSTLQELAAERKAVHDAVIRLRLTPVMFELAAQPHPARQVYRAYLEQSQVFVGIYWQSYGWVAPGEQVSGLEDEYWLSAGMPRLIYLKSPAPDREPRLAQMLARIKEDDSVCYRYFTDAAELQRLVEDDLAMLLSERFEMAEAGGGSASVGALPAPTTPLVDREQEAAEVAELVTRQGARLITFTGPGGVGKSRLAVQAAARLGPEFPDGARFVDLAPVSDAELVPAAIAGGLGLKTSGGRIVADLTSYLHPRRLLLLLDNFEQVTSAAGLIAELLAAAPGLVVLVTSRAVLRLTGEYELAVPPLPVPPAGRACGVADLRGYASVRLFVAQARAVTPGFELTTRNAQAIAGICRAGWPAAGHRAGRGLDQAAAAAGAARPAR